MRTKRYAAVVVAAVLVAATGCTTCGSGGYSVARDAGPRCEVPTAHRNQVYVFAVGGMNPAGVNALDKLRDELNRQGYAKVTTGQPVHAALLAREMRETLVHNPDAVIVVLGSEAGAPTAVKLAEKALADGLPVVSVVILDADGKTAAPALTGVRTLTVGSGYGAASSSMVESVAIRDVGRFALPTDSRTIATLTQHLNEIAATRPTAPTAETEAVWDYPHASPPRPLVTPPRDPEWIFLFDQPGGPTAAIGDAPPTVAAKPTTANTSAQR